MIMMGMYNMGDVPFRHVYLHGLIRDSQGRKMTKSLGNVVDPLLAVNQFGTDALRFTLATGGAPGNDFRLFDEKLESGRNFANKMWNAARFVMQSTGGETVTLPTAGTIDGAGPMEDRWIYSRLAATIEETNTLLGEFQINEASRVLYEFFWNEYCDWYLEMAKVRLKEGDNSPLPVLVDVLQQSLRLLHPIMPFVTENIWQHLRDYTKDLPEALIIAPWPEAGARDEAAEREMQSVIDVVRAIRNIRSERGVDPAKYVEAYVTSDGSRATLETARAIVESLARARPLHVLSDASDAPSEGVVSAVLADAHVLLPLAGMIDVGAERERLGAQLAEAEGEVKRLQGKLTNEQFTSKAPADVVAKERERLEAAETRVAGLRERLAELG
jgi:valyl-tRNA synthetase